MTTLLLTIAIIFGLFIVLYIAIVLRHCLKNDALAQALSQISPQDLPLLTILLAARNEEDNILRCLQSLNALDYPHEKLQILIGNDASTDRTAEIISLFIADKPHFRLFHIHQTLGLARGKANVLATLAHHAEGELWLMLDADIEVRPSWAKCFWQFFRQAQNPTLGIMTGFTLVQGKRLFQAWQALDWVAGLTYIKILSDTGIPMTTLGNNMLVSKKAYWATGGYEKIPFSITEDFALFHAITQKGFHFQNCIHPALTSYTQAVPNWTKLLHQRKRWMRGALQLPWGIRTMLILQNLLLPLAIIGAWQQPWLAWGSLLSLWAMQMLITTITLYRVQALYLVPYLPSHILYQSLSNLALLLYYYLPYKIEWKGRQY